MANHGGSYELRDGRRVLKERTKPASAPNPERSVVGKDPLNAPPTPQAVTDKPSKFKEPKHG